MWVVTEGCDVYGLLVLIVVGGGDYFVAGTTVKRTYGEDAAGTIVIPKNCKALCCFRRSRETGAWELAHGDGSWAETRLVFSDGNASFEDACAMLTERNGDVGFMALPKKRRRLQ